MLNSRERIKEVLELLRCDIVNTLEDLNIDPTEELRRQREFISQTTEQILQIKCKYCPYIKVVSFTPDSELAQKVIDEQRQEIEKLEAQLAQIREIIR